MAKILVVYGSKYGQAAKIGKSICNYLLAAEHTAEHFSVDEIPASLSLINYDAFIIGGGVYSSGYSRKLYKWTKKNSHFLSIKSSAFFSVCLGILQKKPSVDEEEHRIMSEFFAKTGWQPKLTVIFAGALSYSKYNWFLKRIMRSIAKKAGTDTDIKKDYEYTDWKEVQNFTKTFAFSLS